MTSAITGELERRAQAVLEAAWDPIAGFTAPNQQVYPHLWLWDSCFHAIAWAALGDDRAARELSAVFQAQLHDGFVPHMKYSRLHEVRRGPFDHCSSVTQTPVYGHALRVLKEAGCPLTPAVGIQADRALAWLWDHRMSPRGLLTSVHPWESADDSPRFDSWIPHHDGYDPTLWGAWDKDLVATLRFGPSGAAIGNPRFETVSVMFNAVAAWSARELARAGGSSSWEDRADALAAAMDAVLWDEDAGLWNDRPVSAPPGAGRSWLAPTLDGVLGALVTSDRAKAMAALERAADADVFSGPYGLRFVSAASDLYQPDDYWRGTAWMPLQYLVWQSARRWDAAALADAIVDTSRTAVDRALFAEHWSPETGRAHGAVPQSWSALVVAMR